MKKGLFSKVIVGLFLLVVVFLAFQIYSVRSVYDRLDDVPPEYTYGPLDADLKVVEFIKYTCPYCREIHATIMEAVKRDGNVLYIPRPLPSQEIQDAQLVYAAGKQGLFKLAHPILLQDPRIMDEGGLMTIAGEMFGADMERLAADMQSEDVRRLIGDNIDVFLSIGASRTPTFMIGDDIMYVPEGRMPSVEDFLAMFAEARQ